MSAATLVDPIDPQRLISLVSHQFTKEKVEKFRKMIATP